MDIPTIRDTITPVLSGNLNVEINAYEIISRYGIQGVFVRWHRSVSGEEDKKPGKTETLDLNKSGLLDEERVLEIVLNYNKEKQYIFIRELSDAEKAHVTAVSGLCDDVP